MWALSHGVTPIIANGTKANTVNDILLGKRIGTLFVKDHATVLPPAELQAIRGIISLIIYKMGNK